MSEQTRAERSEQAAASPCPYCNQRPVDRNFFTGMWTCSTCDAGGFLMWDAKAGWTIRDTAVPMPLTLEGTR